MRRILRPSRLQKNNLYNDFRIYKNILEEVQEGVWEYDCRNDKYTFFSKNNNYSHLNQIEKTIKNMTKYIHPEDKESSVSKFYDFIKSGEKWYENTYRVLDKHGNFRWIFSRAVSKKNFSNETYNILGIHSDITEKMELNQTLYDLAYFDQLTKLPNREKIKENYLLLIEKNEEKNFEIAFILINIHNLGYINNTLGYENGIDFLKNLGVYLKDRYGLSNISKIDEDNFLIIYTYNNTIRKIENEANSLFSGLKKKSFIKELGINVILKSGISLLGKTYVDFDTMLKNADIALYTAKEISLNRYEVFNDDLKNKSYRLHDLSNELKDAIYNNKLEIYFQPIINSDTELLSGLEALLRWNHPTKGFIPPLEIIESAEKFGLIKELERWIINTVFKQLKTWVEKRDLPLYISINLSGKGLIEKNLEKYLKELLVYYNIKSEKIQFEITESVLLKDIDHILTQIELLQNLGFKVALDDFGTGYSSLNYLFKLKINKIKLDKSFIDKLHIDNRSQLLIKSIIDLSHNLGLEIVAEGIELIEQKEILKNYNCDLFQGYLYCKPMNTDNISQWIRNNFINLIPSKE